MLPEKSILPLGDRAYLITFRSEISPAVQKKVAMVERLLRARKLPGIIETVPGYCSLAVYYDPVLLPYSNIEAILEELVEDVESTTPAEEDEYVRVVRVPVLYGQDCGPDLGEVARHCGLTPEEVILRHSRRAYLVYFIGFTPGFPYLGGMDQRLYTPRLKEPRLRISAGSVGIAGKQTGIYPVDSPGGWQIIGRTPIPLYQPQKDPPTLLRAGNYVRFVPVEKEIYLLLQAEVSQGAWKPQVEMMRRKEVEK